MSNDKIYKITYTISAYVKASNAFQAMDIASDENLENFNFEEEAVEEITDKTGVYFCIND